MTSDRLVILSLFPEVSNVHGDAQNATVLARRAHWAGRATRTVELSVGGSLNGALAGAQPHIVVIGAGFDEDAPRLLGALMQVRSALMDWHAAGTPILAAANGWELLATEVELRPSEPIAGIGLFPGRAVPADKPVAGPIVIETAFGSLVGYEYHSRDYVSAAGELTLGTVVSGRGNGGDSRNEGSRIGNAFGTHLRGPVLARNPSFADALLTLALEVHAPNRPAELAGELADEFSDHPDSDAPSDSLRREAADTLAATVNRRVRSSI